MNCDSGFIEPSALTADRPSACIAVFTSLVGFARRVITPFNDVPAAPPLIPAFAISPSATVVSRTLYPIAPAVGATFLNASPRSETLVFDLAQAVARISAKSALSLAFKPNAVSESVTISETLASSSPLAAARFIMPPIPSIICDEFQPAIAI